MQRLQANGYKFLKFMKNETCSTDLCQLSGSYAFVQCEGSVLMVFNKWRSQWELPAGKREGAETPRECAVRELFEETGQKLAFMEFLGILKTENVKSGDVKLNPVFHATIGQLQPFLENEETSEMKLWDGDEEIGVIDEVDFHLVQQLLVRNVNQKKRDTNARKGRAAAILRDGNKIALIKRTWKGEVYFVFPGGGIEKGESPRDAAEREAHEELGITIRVLDCLETMEYGGTQFFFHAEILSGTFNSGLGDEFTDTERNRGLYEPLWIEIDRLAEHDVRPKQIADRIVQEFKFEIAKKGGK